MKYLVLIIPYKPRSLHTGILKVTILIFFKKSEVTKYRWSVLFFLKNTKKNFSSSHHHAEANHFEATKELWEGVEYLFISIISPKSPKKIYSFSHQHTEANHFEATYELCEETEYIFITIISPKETNIITRHYQS